MRGSLLSGDGDGVLWMTDAGEAPAPTLAMQKLNVGIFIFDDVEVLDFAGPFEVFSRTRLTRGSIPADHRLGAFQRLHGRAQHRVVR